MNKTDLLLRMMEHPQRYTADQWQEILADDECRELYTLMSKTQSAIDAARSNEEITDEMIDAEWEQLAQSHSSHFTLQSLLHYPLMKVAAMFVAVLMLSGLAYAAFQWSAHQLTPTTTIKTTDHKSQTSKAGGHLSVEAPDTVLLKPKLYDNVPLGEIFEDLSAYYHVKVVYQNEEAPRLRLFYQWKPEYTLEKVVEMLNNFDWIQIQTENDTLFIRTTAIPAKDC
ncbi:MAG: DUF4974 domain-containing protein [Prevotella sp.]|nr:DUF4974 domain-containing protein [Prevotella sp.]